MVSCIGGSICISKKVSFLNVKKTMYAYWKSHCMAWSSHRCNGIKGLILLYLDIITLMSDSCVYFRKLLDNLFVYLLLYDNDLLISSKNIFEVNNLKNQLSGELEMKDLGRIKNILGMETYRDQSVGKLYLS
jgi:hypothetical protein